MLALVLLPGIAAADVPRDDAASWPVAARQGVLAHGVAVELAPAERQRLEEETERYVQGVAPPPPAAVPSDPLDRVLTVAGRLPEPATWGLMILGFGGIAGAMRRRLRKSDADFTARIRRIADGDE